MNKQAPIASEFQLGHSCKLQPGLAPALRQSMPYLVQHLFAQASPYATGIEEEAILHRSRMCSFKAPVGAHTPPVPLYEMCLILVKLQTLPILKII